MENQLGTSDFQWFCDEILDFCTPKIKSGIETGQVFFFFFGEREGMVGQMLSVYILSDGKRWYFYAFGETIGGANVS